MDIMAYSYAFSSPPWLACKSSVSPPSRPIGNHLLFSYYSIALNMAFLLLATILTSLGNTGREALANLNIFGWSALSLLIHILLDDILEVSVCQSKEEEQRMPQGSVKLLAQTQLRVCFWPAVANITEHYSCFPVHSRCRQKSIKHDRRTFSSAQIYFKYLIIPEITVFLCGNIN